MSRITKEEIEKTKCGRFLLSDENIYLSIYSLNSYVFEYNLLNTEDRILYHRLILLGIRSVKQSLMQNVYIN